MQQILEMLKEIEQQQDKMEHTPLYYLQKEWKELNIKEKTLKELIEKINKS